MLIDTIEAFARGELAILNRTLPYALRQLLAGLDIRFEAAPEMSRCSDPGTIKDDELGATTWALTKTSSIPAAYKSSKHQQNGKKPSTSEPSTTFPPCAPARNQLPFCVHA